MSKNASYRLHTVFKHTVFKDSLLDIGYIFSLANVNPWSGQNLTSNNQHQNEKYWYSVNNTTTSTACPQQHVLIHKIYEAYGADLSILNSTSILFILLIFV